MRSICLLMTHQKSSITNNIAIIIIIIITIINNLGVTLSLQKQMEVVGIQTLEA